MRRLRVLFFVLSALAALSSLSETVWAAPDAEIVQVYNQPGLKLNKKTGVHLWDREGLDPLVPGGVKTKERLLEFVMSDKFAQAMWLIRRGHLIQKSRDYVQKNQDRMKTIAIEPGSEDAFFTIMAFGQDVLKTWGPVFWVGDHQLICWPIYVQENDPDAVDGGTETVIFVPIACANLGSQRTKFRIEKEERCKDLPWIIEEQERDETGPKTKIVSRHYRKTKEGEICDDHKETLWLEKTVEKIPAKPEFPSVVMSVVTGEARIIPAQPCDTCKWIKIGMYNPNIHKVPRVEVHRLFAGEHGFWLISDRTIIDDAVVRFTAEARNLPDNPWEWSKKKQRFERGMQVFVLWRQSCTGELDVTGYYHGFPHAVFWPTLIGGYFGGLGTGAAIWSGGICPKPSWVNPGNDVGRPFTSLFGGAVASPMTSAVSTVVTVAKAAFPTGKVIASAAGVAAAPAGVIVAKKIKNRPKTTAYSDTIEKALHDAGRDDLIRKMP